MIDLHMHTIYSDGTDSVEELLKKANALNLDIISITDHDSCDAYYELEKCNVNDYYKGKIIVGCEFTTSFDGQIRATPLVVLQFTYSALTILKSPTDARTLQTISFSNNRVRLYLSEIDFLVLNKFSTELIPLLLSASR